MRNNNPVWQYRLPRYQFKIMCSGSLNRTGAQGVMNCDLQPEFQTYDDELRQYPIDAPGFIPAGSTIYYPSDDDDEIGRIPSLAQMILLERFC